MSEKPKAPEPLKNPTPKERFLTSTAHCKSHHQLVDNPMFDFSVDTAVLQYQHQLSREAVDAATASMAGLKMKGVMEFLSVLKLLADTAPLSRPRVDDNLKHI